jgi:hypothetical protein
MADNKNQVTDVKMPNVPMPRRGFLKALGLGSAAAAATVAGDAAIAPVEAQESRSDRAKARYRESEHVKAYYRTNRY